MRQLVRATNDWPVANAAYRSMYRAAANAMSRLASENRAIAGIYARNSYALGTWVPGVSDIDLTIILREPTLTEISDLHIRYDRLRARFPMLGEVEMLDESHVSAWTSHAITGFESKHWLQLAGGHRLQCCYSGDERLDRLRHAVGIYRYNLLPLFWEPKPDRITISRFAAKLFRQLGKQMPLTTEPTAVLTTCLKHLSSEAASLKLPGDGSPLDYARLLDDSALPQRRDLVPHLPPNDGDCVALLGPSHKATPRYQLVRPDVAALDCDDVKTIVMDISVFRFYLSFVDPLEYLTLLRERTVFYGADPLSPAFPLSERAFLGSVKHYAVQMLTCPYRADIGTMPDGSFRDLLYGWFLRTLRFFEDGKMDFRYESLREYFGARHKEAPGPERARLLAGIADELAKYLLADG
jgi:hypothetical protein